MMDGAGHQLLARPRLPLDQHRDVRSRHHADGLKDPVHLRRLAEHAAKLIPVLQGSPQMANLHEDPGLLQYRPRRFLNRGGGKRFHNVVAGPQLQHIHCRANVGMARDNDHRHVRALALDPLG